MSKSFEELLFEKSRQGFDHGHKSDILQRKEQKNETLKNQSMKMSKKMPKVRYSKLPVSIFKDRNDSQKIKTRDPRFDGSAKNQTQIDQHVMKNYEFIQEQQKDQLKNLKMLRKRAKKSGNDQELENIRNIIAEEKLVN